MGAFAVTSHEVCGQVVRDPAFSVQARSGARSGQDVNAVSPLDGSFLELDPPDHTPVAAARGARLPAHRHLPVATAWPAAEARGR